ncbi:MAG: PD40 domain-containing protein [Holophagales bacterium]|nr:PD40 domain-containing protein [Holophagales bacterium]
MGGQVVPRILTHGDPRLPGSGREGATPPRGRGASRRRSRRKGALAFVRPINDLNIWRLPLENGRPDSPARLVASTRQDGGPNFSPDGKRITFSSDRSGSKKL